MRIRERVNCHRETARQKKPWSCNKEPERELDVVLPGRAGAPLVAKIYADLPANLVASVIQRAFEAAPAIHATRQCEDFHSPARGAVDVKRAFADPGSEEISVMKQEDRLLVDRDFTTIVFKREPQDQDRFELYCWYTYDVL